ncbi:MAG: hypothetical protein KJO37_04730 [Bacteroidia bacterium]|nr:hypothetical protein [Bacteroidia bacterium]
MKNSNQSFIKTSCLNLFILGFLVLVTACKESTSKDQTTEAEREDIVKFEAIHWNVKAIHPDGQSLDIKAFDNAGKSYDIKAIQNSDQHSFLDVKAIVNGENLPVKMLESMNSFVPVAAIDKKGAKYYLNAVTAKGEKLEIKGVARFGNIVIMKAMTKKGQFYGVKAISPEGQLNDVKGIKINRKDREMSLRGIGIHAHVKAMHPADSEDDFKLPKKNTKRIEYKTDFKRIIWNIKALTADGKNLDVKAIDTAGNRFDVKATQDSKQHSFMNIKAFVKGTELPVKIMQSEDDYAPIKAIGTDGTIYDIKALTDDNKALDVKGVSRSGNIINVKAINENGDFLGVKAFAPDGKLNQVKGIKIFDRDVEMKVQNHPVYAHLKAIAQ